MKIFGIGLSRTGTKSLTKALRELGFTAKHYPHPNRVIKLADKLDALTDTPVILHYKELYARYPNAKFVLTIREVDSWLTSCKQHFSGPKSGYEEKLRMDIYGVNGFDREKFIAARERHHSEVIEFFSGNRNNLLQLNVVVGDGYEELCPFLGLPVLDKPFPRVTKARFCK